MQAKMPRSKVLYMIATYFEMYQKIRHVKSKYNTMLTIIES